MDCLYKNLFFRLLRRHIRKSVTAFVCFKASHAKTSEYRGNIDLAKVNLGQLEMFLRDRRGVLVSLLQNPNLLEHESFTESLMAVFHITEELAARDLTALSQEDRQHRTGEGSHSFLIGWKLG